MGDVVNYSSKSNEALTQDNNKKIMYFYKILDKVSEMLNENNIPFYIGKTVNFTVRKHYHKKKFGNDINWFFIDSIIVVSFAPPVLACPSVVAN